MDYKITYVAYLTTGRNPIQKQMAFISKTEDKVVIGSAETRAQDGARVLNSGIRMPLISVKFFDSLKAAIKDAEEFCPYDCSWGGIYLLKEGAWEALKPSYKEMLS